MADIQVHPMPDRAREELATPRGLEAVMGRIRQRAVELAGQRRAGEGRALDDWLSAGREVFRESSELVEHSDHYRLTLALPGFEADEISVTASRHELHVQAASPETARLPQQQVDCVHWSNLPGHEVFRRVVLDKPIDAHSVRATIRNGMLSVTARKTVEA
jgi:HSP20 family molecular chaperone IbpA